MVTRLSLDLNALTEINSAMWTGLQHLEHLSLGENYISTISPNAFSGLPHLKVLGLGYNYLTTVHGNMWVGLQSLESLRLLNNRLTEIPPDGFANMPALKELNLQSNQVRTLRPDIIYLRNRPSTLHLQLPGNPLLSDSALCWQKDGRNYEVQISSELRCANGPYTYFLHLPCTSGNQYLASFNYFVYKILPSPIVRAVFDGTDKG